MTTIANPHQSQLLTGATRLDVIDGLRGIAILIVIYQHAFSTYFINYLKSFTGAQHIYALGNGWMGVGFFFVLSGFVLALPYFSGSRNIQDPGAVQLYLAHRAKRLLPLFIFMAVVSFAFYLHKGDNDAQKSMLMAVSSASMFSTTYFFPRINGPFWSLLVEIYFSAALPIILISIMKFGIKRTAIFIIIIAIAIRIPGSYFDFVSIHINPVKDFFIARADDFIAGMVVCYLYINKKIPHKPVIFFIAGISLIFLASTIWDLREQELIPKFISAFANNFSSIGFSLLVVSALQARGLASLILSAWPLRIFGAMCFSIYCWHGLLINNLLLNNPINFTNQFQFWTTLLLLSAATYKYIEFPNEKSMKKLFLLKR